jgi:hypothetical protein
MVTHSKPHLLSEIALGLKFDLFESNLFSIWKHLYFNFLRPYDRQGSLKRFETCMRDRQMLGCCFRSDYVLLMSGPFLRDASYDLRPRSAVFHAGLGLMWRSWQRPRML